MGPLPDYLRSPAGVYQSISCPQISANVNVPASIDFNAINDHGTIAGYYYGSAIIAHAFQRTAAGVCSIIPDHPGSIAAAANGINDSGTVAGVYVDPGNNSHGFLYGPSGGYQTIDDPNGGTALVGVTNTGVLLGRSYHASFYAAPQVASSLDVQPEYTFGAVPNGSSVNPAPIIIRNTSAETIVLGVPSLEMNYYYGFHIANKCPLILSAGQSCSIDVTLAPYGSGISTNVIQFDSTAANAPHTVQLSGFVAGSDLQITPANQTYVFGATPVGTTSGPGKIFLYDAGTVPVHFSSVRITGLNAGDFQITANTCSPTLAGYKSGEIDFTVTPSEGGPRVAQITLQNDAQNIAPQVVTLVAEGQ